jgi:PHP family Zn ribbon phosphoesterase
MKNKITLLTAIAFVLVAGLGCGSIFSGGDNKSGSGGNSNTEQMAKTGVKECDEFVDLINEDAKAPDEGFVARKFREIAIDIAKEAIKSNIEENKNDKEKVALGCKEAKEKYIKDKTEKKDGEKK